MVKRNMVSLIDFMVQFIYNYTSVGLSLSSYILYIYREREREDFCAIWRSTKRNHFMFLHTCPHTLRDPIILLLWFSKHFYSFTKLNDSINQYVTEAFSISVFSSRKTYFVTIIITYFKDAQIQIYILFLKSDLKFRYISCIFILFLPLGWCLCLVDGRPSPRAPST